MIQSIIRQGTRWSKVAGKINQSCESGSRREKFKKKKTKNERKLVIIVNFTLNFDQLHVFFTYDHSFGGFFNYSKHFLR